MGAGDFIIGLKKLGVIGPDLYIIDYLLYNANQ